MTLRRMYKVPDVPIGHILNPKKGFFSVIIPLERTNLVTNPSVETATTGWSGFGSSIARTTTYSYHGAYSLQVTPTVATSDGVQFDPVSLTSGVTYAYSCKFLGVAGRKYLINVSTTGGLQQTAREFTASGRWQWVWGFWKETTTVTRRIIIRKNLQANTDVFYVDGLQVESCADGILAPTTYIDGDQVGLLVNQFPYPYYWTGTPHASTSVRLATTRAGGYVVNFDRFRYRVLAYAGLGLTTVANIAAVPAATDGATYQATIARPRQFVVNGIFDAPSLGTLQRAQSDMYDALGPDSAAPRQPCVLTYQAHDCERPIGREGRIIASYQAGLEGNQDSPFRETSPITFQAYLPTIQAGENGASLTVQTSVTNANYIVQRALNGTWSSMGTGAGGASIVRAIAVGLDGTVYAGGAFTSMDGVSASNIAQWNPNTSTWTAMGTGITGASSSVFTIAIAPNGNVYAGGFFTDAGGSGADHIAVWNGATWAVVGSATAINSTVRSIAFDTNGIMYVGGDFSNAGADANADCLAKWNGSAWSAVGATSINNSVWSVKIGLDGTTLYIGGTFTDAGGVAAADNVAKWDGTSWTALSTGTSSGVRSLAIGLNGALYAGGGFTTIGGVSANYIAMWNGTGWSALGSGLNNACNTITVDTDGTLLIGGDFTTAGGITLADRMAKWNGSAWVSLDIDLAGTPQVNALVRATATGILYLGYDASGTATAAGITTATNNGSARTYPIVAITGPSSGTSRIYQLLNVTTGKLLYLNLTINAGETVTIRTSNNGTTITSSFRGDISSVLLPGSSPDFALEKGNNSISFFAAGSTVTARMLWPVCYQSPADLTE